MVAIIVTANSLPPQSYSMLGSNLSQNCVEFTKIVDMFFSLSAADSSDIDLRTHGSVARAFEYTVAVANNTVPPALCNANVDPDSRYQLLFVFDSAQNLVDTSATQADTGTPHLTAFLLLRRVLADMKDAFQRYRALPVFVNSAPLVATFVFPNGPTSWSRHNVDRSACRVYPPFFAIGCRPGDFVDADSIDFAPLSSAQHASISPPSPVASLAFASSVGAESAPAPPTNPYMRAMFRGRPLWRATLSAFRSKKRWTETEKMRDLLEFACEKMRGGLRWTYPAKDPAGFQRNYDTAAAVCSCTLNLVIESASPLPHRLIRGHMVRSDSYTRSGFSPT